MRLFLPIPELFGALLDSMGTWTFTLMIATSGRLRDKPNIHLDRVDGICKNIVKECTAWVVIDLRALGRENKSESGTCI